MATNLKSDKKLSELVSEIENNAEIIGQYPEISINLAAKKIQVAATKIEASFIGLRIILYMSLAFLLLTIAVAITLYESNNSLKEINTELMRTTQPTPIDSLSNKILLDSSGNLNYSVDRSGKLKSYMDLFRENTGLQDSLESYKTLLELARENFGITYTIKKSGDKTYYSMKSKVVDDISKYVDEANSTLEKTKYKIKDSTKGQK